MNKIQSRQLSHSSHDKADLKIISITADHDLTLFIQCIQNGMQLLRAALRQALALKVVAGHPAVQVLDLHGQQWAL